jgi:hypothetical protein
MRAKVMYNACKNIIMLRIRKNNTLLYYHFNDIGFIYVKLRRFTVNLLTAISTLK